MGLRASCIDFLSLSGAFRYHLRLVVRTHDRSTVTIVVFQGIDLIRLYAYE
jgi:hypothetical protein